MKGCLDDDVILAFAEGGLPADARNAARDHAEACEACRLALSACVRMDANAKGSQEGRVLGRFVVEREIGRGGMGIVYAARDANLERRVALKLLPPWLSGNERAKERLLREARTMARLVHPNVVTVFDVGSLDDGRLFLAMELVEGQNLRLYLRTPRPWQEIVRLFVAAGRGLAQAHTLGIVHRDVKPDNLLVTADGRAKLGDFGLARLEDLEEAEAHSLRGVQAPASTRTGLTGAGAVLGTPAYMAPEQASGGDVDARSDQYSFAVALHEALHGVRPSAEPPRGAKAPSSVRAILARALDPDPTRRYPEIAEMLDALEAALVTPLWKRTNVRIAAGVGGACALAAAALVLSSRAPDPSRSVAWVAPAAPACGPRLARWDAAWSTTRKRAAKDAFDGRAREAPWTGDAYRRFDEAIAAYVAAARRAEDEACSSPLEANRVGVQQCVDLLGSDLEAIVERVSREPTPRRLRHAADAVLALEPTSICARAKPDEPLATETASVWAKWEQANRDAYVATSLGDPRRASRAVMACKPGPEKRKAAAFALARTLARDDDGTAREAGASGLVATLKDAGLGERARELEDALAAQRDLLDQARGAATGRSAGDMLALAAEGGAARVAVSPDRFVAAIAEAEALGLDVLAARVRIARALAAATPPGEEAIEELQSAVARVASRELDHELDAALTELSARRGVVRVSPLGARCTADAGDVASASCALVLAAAADAIVSEDRARDEATNAGSTFGTWHPAHARALVHQAEALVGAGESGAARAREALAMAEADPTLHDLVVRARAALAESEGTPGALDDLTGAKTGDGELLLVPALVARARLARRAGVAPGDAVPRLRAALPRVRRGVSRGRALTEIGLGLLARGDQAGAARALTEALTFAPLLGKLHRSELRFGAARAIARQKRDAARALAEEAAREAPEAERPRIVAWLRGTR